MTVQSAPVLLPVNVGLPKNVSWQGKTVYTGVWKQPVDGPATVRRLNIDRDGQGDTNGHGGEQRRVLVYQAGSYRHWQQHFGRDDSKSPAPQGLDPRRSCAPSRPGPGSGRCARPAWSRPEKSSLSRRPLIWRTSGVTAFTARLTVDRYLVLRGSGPR